MRQNLQNGLFILCCDLALDCVAHWWWQLNPLASHPWVYRTEDQNTLPVVTSKAKSKHLLSETNDLQLSQKKIPLLKKQFSYLTLIHISTVGGVRDRNWYLSLYSVVINSKAVSSVGTEPWNHFQFPVEGHSKVLIYFPGSGLALLFVFMQLNCRLKYISESCETDLLAFSLSLVLSLLFALPNPSDLLTKGG